MIARFYFYIFLTLISISSASAQMVVGSDTLVGNEWISYGRQYYKFNLTEDGVYRVYGSVLQSSGVNLSLVSGANLRLYVRGQQVPIFVSTPGAFTTSDYFEFLGHKNRGEMDRFIFQRPDMDMLNPQHSLYTDKSNYYLSLDGEGIASRVENVPNILSNPPAAAGYYLYEEKLLFTSTHFDPYYPEDSGAVSYSSYMHGEGFSKGSEPTVTINVNASDVAANGPDATLHIRIASANFQNKHILPVIWNGVTLDTLRSQFIHIFDTTYQIPLSLIQSVNQLSVLNENPTGRMTLASVTLTYPKNISAPIAGETTFLLQPSAGKQYLVLDGFTHTTDAPLIYTADGTQRLVTAFDGQDHVHFVWPALQNQTRLRILNPASIRNIELIEMKKMTDWTSDNTQFVIITHPDLMESGTESEYAQYRSSAEGGGYATKAYSILDIYEQFGYDIEKHPQAIRNFVEFAHRHWPAVKMFMIVGRAIEYDRSRYENGSWESLFFVPTFGRPGSDQLLTATLWDLVPRYPISRLAVTDQQTLHEYLEKVKEHDRGTEADQTLEDKAWMKHVMHVTGGMDSQEQQAFKDLMAGLGEQLAVSDFGAKVFAFQKESSDLTAESQSRQIEKLLHEGTSLINYLGHSSTSTFEFNINDPTQWHNKGRYPIFSGMGCSAGQIHGVIQSLSDRYVLIPDQGAIAFISGSGSQFPNSLIAWAKPWYDYFGTIAYGTTLGESVRYGLQRVGNFVNPQSVAKNAYRFLLEQQTTQGDPAIRFNPMPGPDYLVDRNSVSVSPSILNTKQDSFDLTYTIFNIGRNLRQQVSSHISLRSEDGTVRDLIINNVLMDRAEVKVVVRLPLSVDKKPGVYRLLISLDEENTLDELPQPDAELNNKLEDNFGVEGISLVVVDNIISATYPLDFAIVHNSPVTLIATSSNSFVHAMNIILEVDTNGLFNSPARTREVFTDHSGTLKYSYTNSLIPGQEYFWRVSTDSISPQQGYIWSRHSFTYLPDKSEGWSQSHFHQLTDDALIQLAPDSAGYQFKFGRKTKNFRMLNRFHDIPANLVPYFFDDGKFNAKLAQTFRNRDVQGFVVAIDSATGKYLINPAGGLYGSDPLAIPMEGFAYNLLTPQSRQNMINLIENVIPEGYYVFFYTYQHTGFEDYHPEQWANDEQVFGKSIFSAIEQQYPGSMIRTLESKGALPYIVLFQKNVKPIEEKIASAIDDVIEISFDGSTPYKSGKYVSTLIGPASRWGSIEQQLTNFNDTTGSAILSAWALSENLTDTVWISHDITTAVLDISQVDASTHPYLQLGIETVDSSTYKPARIDYWRVLFQGVPEFIINPDAGFQFIADTLYKGQTMSLRTVVENISPYDVDSLGVSLRILGENSQTETLHAVLKPFPANNGKEVYFERSTADLLGHYQVVMEVNPDRTVKENVYSNNIGILPMVVLTDDANPILDVTFDGIHILNGDLVAAKPLILLQLHDESPYLRLNDTSSFEMYLKYPSDNQFTRIPFSADWVTFIQAPGNGKNEAKVELHPDLLEDGEYQLQIKAKDASGNLAGDNDYVISFQVIHKQSISNIYNYPNPFSTATRFVYTLTGESSPAFYKIQIMSITGRLVREITQDEIGPLVVGTHMTEYVWDGTDEYGSPLAVGTYLYRMITKDQNLKDYEKYETSGDHLFKNNWGKLVIIR